MKKTVFIVSFLILLSGCWDKIEIEDRGFVIGATLDQAEEEDQILLTQQFVVPAGIGGSSGQTGGSKPGGSDAFMNVKETGSTPFEIVREVAAKTSRAPFFGHIEAIIISEELAKSRNIGDFLDFFMRDPEMRRGTILLISKGKASEIIDVVPKNEKLPFLYITSLMENTYKNAEIHPKTRLGEVHEYLLSEEGFTMTIIEKEGENLLLKNTAVFKGGDNKMVGTLKREGTIGLNFIRNKVDGGIIKAKVDEKDVLYEIYRSDTGIKAVVKSPDNIQFNIDVQSEGAVIDSQYSRDYTKEEVLNKLEKKFEEKIKKQIKTAIDQCVNEFNSDVLGFGDVLRQNHYKFWEKIKPDWTERENYFSEVDVNINVKVIIRNTGVINKGKKEQ